MKKLFLLLFLLLPLCGLSADIKLPVAGDGSSYVLDNGAYKVCFSDKYGQSIWAFYKLNKLMIDKSAIASDDYKMDARVKNNRITPKEMNSSSLFKTQLFPIQHAGGDSSIQKSTYIATNVLLMSKQLNESIWTNITSRIEEIAEKYGDVYVISGPIFEQETSKLRYILNNKLALPAFFYRIALYYKDGTLVYKCWKFANRIPTDYERICELENFEYNLYQLEAETNIDFFDSSIDTFFRKDKMKYLENHIK